mgnify:CR=1 FL=1
MATAISLVLLASLEHGCTLAYHTPHVLDVVCLGRPTAITATALTLRALVSDPLHGWLGGEQGLVRAAQSAVGVAALWAGDLEFVKIGRAAVRGRV